MIVAAADRTAHVGVPLFVHVLGAMMLIGTLLFVASAIVLGWRRDDARRARRADPEGLRCC